jgi:methionyl aminopeptidase
MITVKTSEEIKIMAEGGKLLAKIIKELEKRVEPGIATNELDRLAESLIFKYGGDCSFKGYQGYPNCLCASINEEIVHAVPSARTLKEGDILSLDIGIKYKDFHTDMAITVPVGKIAPEAQKLIDATKEALALGIAALRLGGRLGDVSHAIQKYIESNGFNVVRELCGHGIGRKLHEDPQILNYGKRGTGAIIKEGMVLCLEPMVTAGDWKLKRARDGFGYQTQDNSLSCHFEHTIAVTKSGSQVLTEI